MADCPNLEKCGFVKKHGDTKNLAVGGFILLYCKTDKQNDCMRKKYKETHGVPPPDDMMPNGAFIKD